VKVLPPSLAREAGFVARFSREVDALKRLKNPHVVELFDSGVDGDTYYYAMEYVDGETLTRRLKRERRIDWREVINLGVQICAALKAAHDAGIIHRDLKPSNLLITPAGAVKLSDFGVAQVFAGTKLTVTGGVIGTAEYMSPEQAQGHRTTKKSDLYSLGAVMYVMLTGRPPFSGKSTLEVIQKHKYGQFDRPRTIVPEIPHWLDDIVCQLLEKDPDKRFADAYVLSLRLKEIPKKVELSRQDLTFVTEGADGSAATMAVGDPTGSAMADGPGGGTLMRDLLRAEIERSRAPSAVGQLLNNTWVLLGLLLLLVAGGFWWFHDRELSPQERFDAGVALMRHEAGTDWLRARDDYFEPLVTADPAAWEEKAAPYLAEIERYEARRELKRPGLLRKKPSAASEPERVLLLARHYYDLGDYPRAERTLVALKALVRDDPRQDDVRHAVDALLEELRGRERLDPDRAAFLQASLDRAQKLADEGRPSEARAIWTSIIELYGSDPDAAREVEMARNRLNKEATAGP